MVTSARLIPLADLVEICDGDNLPLVADLDPYRLGTTPTDYGDSASYGERDPYVPRTSQDVDKRLRAALQPGRMALLVGPSNVGKTRTAFEAIRDRWPQARLLAPIATAVPALARHPRVAETSDAVVVWLDDLQKFVNAADALTPDVFARLVARPGPTVVVATLRTEEAAQLGADSAEPPPDARLLVEQLTHTTIDLTATSEDAGEQAAAQAAYPSLDLSTAGLSELLAGPPALLRRYRDAQHDNPVLHSVLQTAVDWVRVGMPRPASAEELIGLVGQALLGEHPDVEPDNDEIDAAIKTAATPTAGPGRVAALKTLELPDHDRGYLPFESLVAADDELGAPRAIPEAFWNSAVELATPEEAFDIGLAAVQRAQITTAVLALSRAANAGNTDAMFNLGFLLADQVDPPQLEEARRWYEQAANAGNTDAMFNLGFLLADQVEPPQLEEARRSYEQAANLGHSGAMFNLGNMLAYDADPAELEAACRWYEEAANAGHTDSMFSLGFLLADHVDPPELEQARGWYEEAANAGHTDAMFNLARLLATQLDPPQLEQARRWYEQAAIAGHTDAMFNLGVLLADRTAPAELDEARNWYERAASAGHIGAMFNLGFLLANRLDPPELDEACRWYEQAASTGRTSAMFNLGNILAYRLQPHQLDKARHWYEQAANTGHTRAMFNLGNILAYRLYPPQLDEARHWYEQAASAGHVNAMINLGNMLATRVDPPQLEEARHWYEQAANAGHGSARNSLPRSAETG